MPIAPIPPLPPLSSIGTSGSAGAAGVFGAGASAGAAAGALTSLGGLQPGAGATAAGAVRPGAGLTAVGRTTAQHGFASILGSAIDSLQNVQNTASVAEASAAAGQGSLTDTMIAASEASLDTQVATAVLNKGLAAYTTIADMAV
ncbi:MAG: flagellar hook-basal body complex protein FliE [Acidimicrobiales bacterium]